MMWVVLAWIGLLAPVADDHPRPKPEAVTVTGRVVELTEALKATGIKADADPVAQQVVVVGDDGAITPLLSDEASRALFKDGRLRGRKAEVQGRKFQGVPYVQVLSFKVEDQGTLKTPEYFCDICTISVRDPQPCPCCQAEMVLRFRGDDER
ncbi:MAG TPA: hypothetical protein VG406_24420 [Isosphaeraceae bacterium]|jgi:hypothetical protein|nr:hypothetical protein [Isosphaeraceae bacterium]